VSAFSHGTLNGYNYHRCRCDECRTAHNAYRRGARIRRAHDPAAQIPHGTRGGYNNYGCFCDPCRESHLAYMREYHARRRAAS
jgi:hypothetical protein